MARLYGSIQLAMPPIGGGALGVGAADPVGSGGPEGG
jgi:hypothetical protein